MTKATPAPRWWRLLGIHSGSDPIARVIHRTRIRCVNRIITFTEQRDLWRVLGRNAAKAGAVPVLIYRCSSDGGRYARLPKVVYLTRSAPCDFQDIEHSLVVDIRDLRTVLAYITHRAPAHDPAPHRPQPASQNRTHRQH